MNNNVKIFFGVIAVLIVGLAVVFIVQSNAEPTGPGKYDEFATCLKDKGAIFYGAFWCSHCKATKKLFGASTKLLPYVECSTPDASGQTQECTDKNITSYPTWVFADKTELKGEVTFQQLADKTSCVLPILSQSR
ncbi:MAG: VKORC1/thioredoxin domain protein [Candidatus Nomurabacteria bacterium GW2011_GWC2_35_8]|uniref:VKORC1/thioredoxin domain protein n=1 Tax=Candidatus Nomurabacteria bacterium GW2011_GWC2_35_8 TaxID=1618752 RepID=A0A0G0G7T8_9BACT|nr:MAG: VKORC1/thioredoxin domain protein [Candidatus Nomurabacteria bacterium GW2011_GWC2_35_8]